MRNALLWIALLFLLSCCAAYSAEIGLWPEIEPYGSDFLKVSQIHKIRYELGDDGTNGLI
jgi:hypothetical protein